MKILKFTESISSSEILKEMFDIASKQFEEISDFFIDIEDDKSFSFGYNFCVYYPGDKNFKYSIFALEDYRDLLLMPGTIKDDILSGECNISYLVGIAIDRNNLKKFNYRSFGLKEDGTYDDTYFEYDQSNFTNWIKLNQILKQFDMRIEKSKYNVKYQFDGEGVSILIGVK